MVGLYSFTMTTSWPEIVCTGGRSKRSRAGVSSNDEAEEIRYDGLKYFYRQCYLLNISQSPARGIVSGRERYRCEN